MTSTLKTEKIQFRGDNSEVILLGSEKMGIGPNPVLHQKLNIQSSAEAGIQLQNNTSGTANSTDGGRVSYYEDDLYLTNYEAAGKQLFYVGNNGSTKAMEITSNGYVNKPNQPAFKTALVTTAQTISNQTWTRINLNHSYFNIGGHYNITASGTNPYAFTAPIAGIYFFSWTMNLNTALNPGGYYYTALYKNGSVADGQSYINGLRTSTGGVYIEADTQFTGACLLQLAVNDYVEPYAYGHFNGNSSGGIQAGGRTFMTGCLIA